MNTNAFILTSDECELLMAFESAPTLEKLAGVAGRDISSLSRSLSKIASKLPVVEKRGGRWFLTDHGKQLNQQTRDAIQFQRSLFQRRSSLRIGTNREFAARILGARIGEIMDLFPETLITITTYENGTETALLEGSIDFGIDCERPFDPLIAYRVATDEPIVAVCSPSFKKTNQKSIAAGKLLSLPHLLCHRLFPDKMLSRTDNNYVPIAIFNDIGATRSACEAGAGWALLPRYSVAKEIDQGTLRELDINVKAKSSYGLWWLRSRSSLQEPSKILLSWLSKLEL